MAYKLAYLLILAAVVFTFLLTSIPAFISLFYEPMDDLERNSTIIQFSIGISAAIALAASIIILRAKKKREESEELIVTYDYDESKLHDVVRVDGKIVFKYHPNVYGYESIEYKSAICQCCNKTVTEYYKTMYCKADINYLCLECIASGRASMKFRGSFVQDAELDKVEDLEKVEELFNRTPGYMGWQGEYWRACCNDFCAFIGNVGIKDLEEIGIKEEVLAEYATLDKYDSEIMKTLDDLGPIAGYLFQCLHCKKYYIWADSQEDAPTFESK